MKFHFISSNTSEAISAKEKYINSYHQADPSIADVIIPIGGDGILLKSLHDFNKLNKPFFGINYGSVGFLMNSASNKSLVNLKLLETYHSDLPNPCLIKNLLRLFYYK